jgi:hypothetical protein
MDRDVKIRLSVGLVAAIVIHAMLTAFVFTGLHHRPSDAPGPWLDAIHLPTYDAGQFGQTPITGPDYGSPRPAALDELKKSGPPTLEEPKGQRCIPCRPIRTPQPTYPSNVPTFRPAYVQPSAVQPPGYPSGSTPATIPAPVATPAKPFPTPAAAPPSATIPAPASASKPATGTRRPQIALFLDGSAASKRLEQWWNTDPALLSLRKTCEFQTYTPTNALYLARYADVVPVGQFPAVLFQHADGGHIHAAGGNMLPTGPAQLYADLEASYRLAESVANAPGVAQAGAMRERGYNWDKSIQEMETLNPVALEGDCGPGMICPDDERRPMFPRLFPDVDKSAILWAGGSEIGTWILCALIAGVVGLILWKRL